MFNFNFDAYELLVWGATLLFCIIAVFLKRFPLKRPGALGQPLVNPVALILPLVFFVLFAGYRKNTGDTFFYQLSFELMPDSGNPVTASEFFGEMFSFFQNWIRNKTDDPQALIMFSSVFALPVPFFVLYRYCYPFEMGLFMIVAYGYIGGMMNGMRQYMAAAITLCATSFLFSRKRGSFIKFAAVIMLAYCMHNSALIMIPLYFVVRRPAWKATSYLLTGGSVVLALGFDAVLPSFLSALESTNYSTYAENGWFTEGTETGANIGRALVAAAPIVIAYLNKDRVRKLGHRGDILINIAFVNLAINTLAVYNWIFTRLTIYLMIYYIIFLVWVVNFAVPYKDRTIYVAGAYLCFFLYSRLLSYQIATYESDYFFPDFRRNYMAFARR